MRQNVHLKLTCCTVAITTVFSTGQKAPITFGNQVRFYIYTPRVSKCHNCATVVNKALIIKKDILYSVY